MNHKYTTRPILSGFVLLKDLQPAEAEVLALTDASLRVERRGSHVVPSSSAATGEREREIDANLKGKREEKRPQLKPTPRLNFTLEDVLDCMKECNLIGRGGAGVVFLCRTPAGGDIAVKKLFGYGGAAHDHGFRAEVKTLGNIRHRNIVRLLAFCSNSQANSNVLVYEYMPNGSLGEVLHGKRSSVLTWKRRYAIALEAARGLCYLHHDCRPMIIHRDVKSNNILLDSEFRAHVADFGLAKFLRDGAASECMSAIAGSYGYIAPGKFFIVISISNIIVINFLLFMMQNTRIR